MLKELQEYKEFKESYKFTQLEIIEKEGKEYFSPINPSPDYQIIKASESSPVVIQGKVIGVYSDTAIIE